MKNQVSNYELEKYCHKLRPVLEKMVSDLNYKLLDLSFVNEKETRYLRLTISSEDGSASLDDCERVSREIGKEIDMKNLIPFSYILEVQSPGISGDIKDPACEFVIKDLGFVVKS